MGAARVASFSSAKLRELRVARGLSQTQLAKLIPGWRKSDIWRYENGLRWPSPDSLTKLASGLGVTAAELTTAVTAPGLADMRQIAGLTQQETARLLNLTVDQWARLEHGQGNIDVYAGRVAELFEVPPAQVVEAHSRRRVQPAA